jgi:hypothetical protein
MTSQAPGPGNPPEYHLDPAGVDGPPPGIEFVCCAGTLIPYPTEGSLSTCPKCGSVFILAGADSPPPPLYLEPGLIIGPDSPWRNL